MGRLGQSPSFPSIPRVYSAVSYVTHTRISPFLRLVINDIVAEKRFLETVMIGATTLDFSCSVASKEFHQTRSRNALHPLWVSARDQIVARFHRPIPSNKATRATLSRSPTPYISRCTCSGIVNNLSSRASPCFDPLKCLLTRSVELQ